ncbi:MAG: hypothetical protein ACW987_17010 [Candidatus Thorarchaeota archaeon]
MPLNKLMGAQSATGTGPGSVPRNSNLGKVKVSADDTTDNFLQAKLQEGSNITLTVINDGGDEKIEITSTASGSDDYTPGIPSDWDDPAPTTISGALDRLVSVVLPIGSLYNGTLGATQMVATATIAVMEAFETTNISQRTIVTPAVHTITLVEPGDYQLEYSCNFNGDANNLEVITTVFVNGVSVPATAAAMFFKAAGDRETLTFSIPIVGLSAGDVIDLRMIHDDAGTVTFTYYASAFSVIGLGMPEP